MIGILVRDELVVGVGAIIFFKFINSETIQLADETVARVGTPKPLVALVFGGGPGLGKTQKKHAVL